MKRYFRISLTLFAFSALNVLTYLLLGVIIGNTAYSEIFSLTYSLQFIAAIILSLFATASNIRANKENDTKYSFTGLILVIVIGGLIFGIIAGFVDGYISFMNMSNEMYRTFTLMAIGQIFFSLVINAIAEKLYFEDKDKRANLYILIYIILNLLTVTITALITKNQLAILITNLSILFLFVVVCFFLEMKKFKFSINIIKNFKFESSYIIINIFMFIIYFFGYSRAFSFGAQFITALNFVNLFTDPSWDALVAINKIAKIDLSKGLETYNFKKAIGNSLILTLSYIVFDLIVFFSLFSVYNVELKIGIIYITFQVLSLLLYSYTANVHSLIQLENSATKATLINLIFMAIRTLLVLIIFSPYNSDIAQLIEAACLVIVFVIIRFRSFNLDSSGVLHKKEKSK